jgi:hypothetical protein
MLIIKLIHIAIALCLFIKYMKIELTMHKI